MSGIISQPNVASSDLHSNNQRNLSEEIKRLFLLATWVPVAAICVVGLLVSVTMSFILLNAIDDRIGDSVHVISSNFETEIEDIIASQNALKEQLTTIEKSLIEQSAQLERLDDKIDQLSDARRQFGETATASLLPIPTFNSGDYTSSSSKTGASVVLGFLIVVGIVAVIIGAVAKG